MSSWRRVRPFSELERSAAAREAAYNDARALALEISRGVSSLDFNAMSAGRVLAPDETAYRWVGVWLVVHDAGAWAAPSWAQILITDQRLLRRCGDGFLLARGWTEVTGLRIGLDQQQVVLNHGDYPPIAFMGLGAVDLAVAAVANVYGCPALLTHPALASLRSR